MKMKHIILKNKIVIIFFIFLLNSTFSNGTNILETACAPNFSHRSGRYNTDIQVQLTTSTSEASIYFTTDGTIPNSTSQLYDGTISIAGDGNLISIRAIAIKLNSISTMSTATYIIDYSFDPNADYLTDLTWEEYNNFITGDWFGYTINPWTTDYNVYLSINTDGNYRSRTSSPTSSCQFQPVFYYATNNDSPLKTLELYNILPSGYANGYIDIYFDQTGGNVVTDDLRFIKFIDDENLYLEMWHLNQYGPLKYYLTKSPSFTLSINNEYQYQKTSVYPNPASDFMIIKDLNSNVQFVNLLGQSYLIEKNEKISVSHLPRGFYIISFTNNKGISIKQKLILK
jgi:hypothetical protein